MAPPNTGNLTYTPVILPDTRGWKHSGTTPCVERLEESRKNERSTREEPGFLSPRYKWKPSPIGTLAGLNDDFYLAGAECASADCFVPPLGPADPAGSTALAEMFLPSVCPPREMPDAAPPFSRL